ncbi:phosphate signaling complex protein PhoU [Corynebacterium mendelii]|uniref:Phosphate signaling complex protein PhoU n=1 Tax=Corynebacterium mendelii TaxID=2765362 RepID=A0A939IUK2_9CORY|nr:phosphate signaling complex protein PhoU [Corynebacterium mendelii]MBN9645019.1 phosphate signaling complex protein PhoU [Corynebacterium mendelii]
MRTSYREHLDTFSHDLIIMCDMVQVIMVKASEALLERNLTAAEEALSLGDDLKEVKVRCEERAVQLLALEGPLARDLRQVVSSIYIVEDISRMAALAKHVASTARRRHPASAVPEPLEGYFRELYRVVTAMTEKLRDLLIHPEDVDVAMVFGADDDAVDDIQEHLFVLLTQREWEHSTTEAVDVSMLSRYYERYADHTVNVASRIVYLSTGMKPDEYLAKREEEEREAEMQRRFAELERSASRP